MIQAALRMALCAAVLTAMAWGQETRGAISGHVTDPQATAVAGARVVVTNTDTNVSTDLKTNDSGFYEATLLVSGNYQVMVEATGFNKAIRKQLVLPIGTRLQVDMRLEVGAVTETVTVSGGIDLINTDELTSGGVLESKSALDLPNPGGNTIVLAKMTVGLQSSQSVADWSVRLHSTGAGSNYTMAGGVGGNEYSVDGVSNNGGTRNPGYMPAPDLVEAMRVETSAFDAANGHSTGANVAFMTRAGTNLWHGSLRENYHNFKWNAMDFFAKQAYNIRIAQAAAKGDNAQADQLRENGGHQPGYAHQFSSTFGGPVIVPKVFNGRNKLFFFFGYAGFRVRQYYQTYQAVPSEAMRQGDFSSLLAINSTNYQVYDPLSTVPDPTRSGHVVRTPFAGNIVPQNRIINPMYGFYSKLLPLPNNPPVSPSTQPNQNFIAYSNPYRENYNQYANRIDYNTSAKDRFFFRWSWNDWRNLNSSWMVYTNPPLNEGGNTRHNVGVGLDWVHTFGGRAMMDVTIGSNQYLTQNTDPGMASILPSGVGLPAYMDGLASAAPIMPNVTWSGWSGITQPLSQNQTRYRSLTGKAEFSFIGAHHTLKTGFDARGQYATAFVPANNAGSFGFTSTWTQRTDDGYQSAGTGNYGGSWASFMMGLPGSMSIDQQASSALFNPYYAAYVQDAWRIKPRLTLNLGLRLEYELGPTERYDRMLGTFDPAATLPIAAAAIAAYSANQIPGVPVSQLTVMGGNTYPGVSGRDRKQWNNQLQWMPRISMAYQLDHKTVLRAGAGRYFDTLNVQNETINQTGFSNTTTTTISNDFGQTWVVGNPGKGVSPLTDPFPVLPGGGRVISAIGSSLGAMTTVGKGYTFIPYDRPHARQNRWRLDVQRMLDNATVITVGYAGTYTDHTNLSQSLSAVPFQYYSFDNARNNTVANNWNANVTNPFYIGNFASLAASNAALYQYMQNNSFFTSKTIAQNKLWGPYQQMNGLTMTSSKGKVKTEELQVSFQRRFTKGFNVNLAYTRLYQYNADYFPNPYDTVPAWQPGNNGRPHRLVTTAVTQLPFGKGRRWGKQGPVSWLFGGYQLSVIQEYQPGALVSWGSTTYYKGRLEDLCNGPQTLGQWFDTSNFVTDPTQVSTTGQARVFPNFISGYGSCRANSMKNFNASLARDFRFLERAGLQVRVDMYNIGNHGLFNAPNTSPTSGQFGQVTSQVSVQAQRAMTFQARVSF
jgi:hypothetical protein